MRGCQGIVVFVQEGLPGFNRIWQSGYQIRGSLLSGPGNTDLIFVLQ